MIPHYFSCVKYGLACKISGQVYNEGHTTQSGNLAKPDSFDPFLAFTELFPLQFIMKMN